MKTRFFLPTLVFTAVLGVTGCDLETEIGKPPLLRPANHLVINEVMVLPPTQQRSFRWIELYNPTDSVINVFKWSFSYLTRRTVIIVDSTWNPLTGQGLRGFSQDTVDVRRDVPIRYSEKRWAYNVRPGEFFTIISDRDLLNYTDWGSGTGPWFTIGDEFTVVDSIRGDSIRIVFHRFVLQTSDRIELKDSAGTVIDAVSYGNYDNTSIGFIPAYQSIARYAGAYKSGSTKDDFYITGVQISNTRPIPHWLSQAYKE